ncbi:unnamed protein product [Staurois parvus]|uniref:Uncharacterized protein n=1 Tax=Staurois parvus TaxID=386267 RepID=A0ABN9BAB7_9NEOB|nr:unnamed protein product [Staurois parvus]
MVYIYQMTRKLHPTHQIRIGQKHQRDSRIILR